MTMEQRVELESMVDTEGLGSVLMELERIAYEKGDHLRINWQDAAAARLWDRAAKHIAAAAMRVQV